MKILYVDDEQDLLDIIPDYFDDSHEWELKTNAKDAIQSLNSTQYDLVIVDFLPNLDSLEILEICRQKNIKFVMFTGNDQLEKLPDCTVVIKPDISGLAEFVNITKKAA
jgi:DNA-binding response OmpR family regulator